MGVWLGGFESEGAEGVGERGEWGGFENGKASQQREWGSGGVREWGCSGGRESAGLYLWPPLNEGGEREKTGERGGNGSEGVGAGSER